MNKKQVNVIPKSDSLSRTALFVKPNEIHLHRLSTTSIEIEFIRLFLHFLLYLLNRQKSMQS